MVSQAVGTMHGLSVCGAAASAEEALEYLPDAAPDVVIVDMALPGMSGTDLIATLQQNGATPRCLVLSGHSDVTYAKRALAAGSQGYVLKGSAHELEEAIREVLAGKTYLSQPLRQAF